MLTLDPFASPDDHGSIPPHLYSYETGRPFDTCLMCGGTLNGPESERYEIQKCYRNSEVVLEFSICENCGSNLGQEYSKESEQVIGRFILEIFLRCELGRQGCHKCAQPMPEAGNHLVTAICQRSELLFPPVYVCEGCEDQLHEQLSKKTRDLFGEFIGGHFPGVPEGLEAPTLGVFR